MKTISVMICALAFCSPALGADFSLQGTYGNPPGCAIAAKSSDIPSGHAEAVAAQGMWDGDAICTILDSSAPQSTADGTSWDVKVSCQAGDDVAEVGTVQIVQSADKSFIDAKVPDKVGPKGRLKLCPAQ